MNLSRLRVFPLSHALKPGLCLSELRDMAEPIRLPLNDDEWHERRRLLAIPRPPLDFEAERLKRLVEKVRATRDP